MRVSLGMVAGIAAALLVSASVSAMEIAGVKLEPKTKVGNAELVLNGAGLRKRVIVNVYVGALYLQEKKSNGNDVINAAGAKRIYLHMLRDLTGQQFVDAMKESVKYNTPQAELDKLAAELNEFYAQLGTITEMKSGTAVAVDFVPGSGIQLSASGKSMGKPIASPDLFKAVMRIYVGDKPVDEGLKKGMLGA
jgi:uncharacterized protein YfaP (DUF2135 family)